MTHFRWMAALCLTAGAAQAQDMNAMTPAELLPSRIEGLDSFRGCATIIRDALLTPNGLFVAGLVVQRWCRVRADENDDDPRGPGLAVGLGPEDLDPA